MQIASTRRLLDELTLFPMLCLLLMHHLIKNCHLVKLNDCVALEYSNQKSPQNMHVLYAAYCLEISFVAGGCNNSLLANLDMECLPCIDIKQAIYIYFIQGYVHNKHP